MRVSGLCLAGLMVVASTAIAHSETLTTALGLAYRHNSTLNAQRAATRAADEALAQAKSGFRPTVVANGDVSRTVTTTRGTAFGDGTTALTPYGYSVTIDQALFNGFQNVNGAARAEATIRASREQLSGVEQQIFAQGAQAYAQVLLFQDTVQFRQRNIAFLDEQLRSSRARLDVGEGTRTDVAQSQAQLALARARLFSARADLATAKGTYFQIFGRQAKNLSWAKTPAHLLPHSLNRAMELAVTQHPNVRGQQQLVDAQSYFVKQAEGGFLPTIGLRGQASRRYNQQGDGTRSDSVQLTLNATVPIYQGGRQSSLVRERKETLSQQRILVDQQRDAVRAQAVNAWSQHKAAQANILANSEGVRAARLALDGVTEERNVGQRTQLDVLNAQNALIDAQVLQVQARATELAAGYALIAAIGQLNSQRLGLQVRHYNPKAHYKAVKDLWFGLRTPTGR